MENDFMKKNEKILSLMDQYKNLPDVQEKLNGLADLCIKFSVLVDSDAPMIEVLQVSEELVDRLRWLNTDADDYVEENVEGGI